MVDDVEVGHVHHKVHEVRVVGQCCHRNDRRCDLDLHLRADPADLDHHLDQFNITRHTRRHFGHHTASITPMFEIFIIIMMILDRTIMDGPVP
jgi:hypothetical protein